MSYKKKTLRLSAATFLLVFGNMMAGGVIYSRAINQQPTTRYEHRAYKTMLNEYKQFKTINGFLFMLTGLLYVFVSIVQEE